MVQVIYAEKRGNPAQIATETKHKPNKSPEISVKPIQNRETSLEWNTLKIQNGGLKTGYFRFLEFSRKLLVLAHIN